MSEPTIPTMALRHGVSIPRIGIGTWQLANDATDVATAIGLGYRLIDTAYAYRNEEAVGQGIRTSGVPREELFISGKLNAEWHGYREAQQAFAGTARRLGVDYLDLYSIHWPNPTQDRYVEAWRGLEKLLEDGKVRAIGLSNFKPAHIERLLAETDVAPHVNQIELNPLVSREATRRYNAGHGIATQSWSPLGKGGALLAADPIVGIAETHGRTPAQIVLRWHMELGLIAVPKSSTPARLAENMDIFGFDLLPEEVRAISTLDQGEAAAIDSDLRGH